MRPVFRLKRFQIHLEFGSELVRIRLILFLLAIDPFAKAQLRFGLTFHAIGD